eukprot:scaffold172025_cov41-Tisochrysis_lutea.AAC.4
MKAAVAHLKRRARTQRPATDTHWGTLHTPAAGSRVSQTTGPLAPEHAPTCGDLVRWAKRGLWWPLR